MMRYTGGAGGDSRIFFPTKQQAVLCIYLIFRFCLLNSGFGWGSVASVFMELESVGHERCWRKAGEGKKQGSSGGEGGWMVECN